MIATDDDFAGIVCGLLGGDEFVGTEGADGRAPTVGEDGDANLGDGDSSGESMAGVNSIADVGRDFVQGEE